MATLANLAIKLDANASPLMRNVEKAESSIKGFAETASQAAKVAATAFIGSATAIGLVVSRSAEAAKEIDSLSMVAGVSAERLQSMAHGAKAFSVEQDKLSDILKDVNDKVGDFMATGAGPMKDFFENIAPQVGVTADQFRNLNSADALQLYVSSLEKANVNQAEMTFYMEALASDATALVPLLRDGGAAMRAQAEEAEALGLVLSDVDIAILKQTDQQMGVVSKSFGAFFDHLSAEFAPLINVLSNEFLNVAKEAGGFGAIATSVFDATVKAAGVFANILRGLEIGWMSVKLGALSFVSETINGFVYLEESFRALANVIPGIEVASRSSLGAMQESFAESARILQEELIATVQEPWPLDNVVLWAEEVKSQAEQAAQSVRSVAPVSSDEEGAGVSSVSSILGKDPDETLVKLEESLMLQEEVLASAYERRQAMLDSSLESKLVSEDKHNALSAKNQQKYLDGILKKQFFYDQKQLKWDDLTNKQKVKVAQSTWQTLTAGVSSSNETIAKINKAFAIKDAIVNTYRGVSQSLAAYPMPIAAAFAAAHLAAGIANVQQIKSGGGGGGVSGGSVSSASVPAISSIVENTDIEAAEEQAPERQKIVTLNIEGVDDDALLSKNQLRMIVDQINEEESANVKIVGL